MSEQRVRIGNVWVDAGMVWIGDPCYVLGADASHGPKTWEEFCDKLDSAGRYTGPHSVYTSPLGEGIGFAVDSGYGDGSYPVTVVLDEQTGRVKSLHVDFWGDAEDEEDINPTRAYAESVGLNEVASEEPHRRCDAPYPGVFRIGNQIDQHPTCMGSADHEGRHWAVVLDSDDNAITESWS